MGRRNKIELSRDNRRYYPDVEVRSTTGGLVSYADARDLRQNQFAELLNLGCGKKKGSAVKAPGYSELGCGTAPNRVLEFTTGAHEPEAGETLTGSVSGSSAVYRFCELTGGSWGGGDAAGYMYLTDQEGDFESENLVDPDTTTICVIGGNSVIWEIINLYFAVLQKAGTETGLLVVQLNGDVNGLDLLYNEYTLATAAWGGWQLLAGNAGLDFDQGLTVKADRVNFQFDSRGQASAMRLGCGSYADSPPVWIGYVNREKDVDENGYFNNAIEYVGIYTDLARMAECDFNGLIGASTLYYLTNISGGTYYGGKLINTMSYYVAGVWEYDGFQEGNCQRDQFYSFSAFEPVYEEDVLAYTNEIKITVTAADLSKRATGLGLYLGIRPRSSAGITIGEEGLPECLRLGRIDINKDTEWFYFAGQVDSADLNQMVVYLGDKPDWASDCLNNMYIKYKKVGESSWTTKAISNTVADGWPGEDQSKYLKIYVADNYDGAGDYDVRIVSRWSDNGDGTYSTYILINHGMEDLGSSVYGRKFDKVNYRRIEMAAGMMFGIGNYVLADLDSDRDEYLPMVLRMSSFNAQYGTPDLDKLSRALAVTGGGLDDEIMRVMEYDYDAGEMYDPGTITVYMFSRREIYRLHVKDGEITSMVNLHYGVGLAAADSLMLYKRTFYFLGSEGGEIGWYKYHPGQGAAERISDTILDRLAGFNKKYLKQGLSYHLPGARQIRFTVPEFAG